MANKQKPNLDTELLYRKLKLKHLYSQKELEKKHPDAILFFKNKQLTPGKIRQHAAKLLTSGALASSLLLASPQISIPQQQTPGNIAFETAGNLNQSLSSQLAQLLPKKIIPLTADQETKIGHLFYKVYGINAVPQLGSTKLNHSYGLIGAEQHLPRYPGDTLEQHQEYLRAGITPGLGAWGYFAPSKDKLTEDLINKEKYYVAVQTLYLSDWVTRFKYLRDWYKYRKVVVTNPVNGKTIVCDVADAGPSWWTGKHFGGSPEVVAYLELNVYMQKGPVVLYFVDDPEDKVPLGPLEYNLEKGPPLLAQK